MLRDITIENYRLFEKFHLEGMTQINLLVGTNNSGKSSLLEAIYLLVCYEDPTVLFELLHNRGEFVTRKYDDNEIFQIAEIFRGHQLQKDCKIVVTSHQDKQVSLEYKYLDYGMSWPSRNVQKDGLRIDYILKEASIGFVARDLSETESFGRFGLEDDIFSGGYSGNIVRQPNKYFMSIDRLSHEEITAMWNQIVLTPKEDMVLGALRILEANLERIALMSHTTPEMSVRLKIKDRPTPVPLGSMGDGMYRILALAMSLVSSEKGVLLVDEIDTGLHYKALTNMWRLVIETAKKLDVQVFATTHSWDCLAAFQQALTQSEENALGTVFRLERKNGQIEYTAYTGEELTVAVEHDIEVR